MSTSARPATVDDVNLIVRLYEQSEREMLVVWERIAISAGYARANGNVLEHRNLETAGNSFIVWWRKHAPAG